MLVSENVYVYLTTNVQETISAISTISANKDGWELNNLIGVRGNFLKWSHDHSLLYGFGPTHST